MPRDSEILRDIILTIDPSNPMGKTGKLTRSSHIRMKMEYRGKQETWEKAFQKKCAMKERQGLYPVWSRDGVLKGWSGTPSTRKKYRPWWEENLPVGVRLADPRTV
jgi:hypothetical protein